MSIGADNSFLESEVVARHVAAMSEGLDGAAAQEPDMVRQTQAFLRFTGYNIATDDRYGNQTLAALIAYSLTPAGQADQAIQDAVTANDPAALMIAVNNDFQERFDAENENGDIEFRAAILSAIASAVESDNDVEDIKAAQTLLTMQGFQGADGQALTIDGDVGDNTRFALQQSQDVSVTEQPLADLQAEPVEEAEIIVEAPPFGIAKSFEVTRNDVLTELADTIASQENNPEAPRYILAYSEEANSYMLVHRSDITDARGVYQISDTNVERILSGIEDGSIALDSSASRMIAETVHGNNPRTVSYTTDELRSAFAASPQRFTHETREELLTTTMERPDGLLIRFAIDDLHDALDKMDSRRDWPEASDPAAVASYVSALRQAAEDAREERTVTAPQWHEPLTFENAVEIKLGDETILVPTEVWEGIEGQLQRTESGFSTTRDNSTLRTVFETYVDPTEPEVAPDVPADPRQSPVITPGQTGGSLTM